jgi:hypothetical protein
MELPFQRYCVQYSEARGNRLLAIMQANARDAGSLRQALSPLGRAAVIEQADPTLEDVFTALTRAAARS